jgi:hypothetical protein
LPFGRTQDLSLRNRTTAMRGLEPSRSKIPPAARIGARAFAESVMSKAMPDELAQSKRRIRAAEAWPESVSIL